ncbi:riboflavin synthase subunit alpha [Acidihalobacter yilgarnensis]|uniref:Riboflavin synthase n=1 Tax=Acidihalobacter yilgarnensis TaxID=2819280 RepID=A0A1D8ILE9_9GAMM|nr:riboflavin synthase [Acidihalobacter yilgarnensis]AOU97294.1 riboflavin synthase subunit alpha [Acidihalobacter yilgarnensis]
MFTGIIEAVGSLRRVTPRGGDARLVIDVAGLDLTDASVGDSIAVNGVCLTAVELQSGAFAADVSAETLSRSTLGALGVGASLNLELAMRPTTRLGGHLVSGHVDGVGEIVERRADARSVRFVLRAPDRLARYIAEKGSICVDGISLTVNDVDGARFDINIVPHTLEKTTLGQARVGQSVNLEVDVIARYLERLLLGDGAAREGGAITRELLARHGYLTDTD